MHMLSLKLSLYSHRFARLAAAAFLNAGIPVYLFGKIVPTPFVPFTVIQLGAAAGVMVTASHNPKEDNGYKVYWENGAQVKWRERCYKQSGSSYMT